MKIKRDEYLIRLGKVGDCPRKVPLALTEAQVPRASGAISGAEFDKVAIMDGKASGGTDPSEYVAVNMSLCVKSWCDILRAK